MHCCPRCGFSTKSKHNLKTHYQRSTPCAPVLADLDVAALLAEQFPQCTHCGKACASQQSKNKHEQNCPDVCAARAYMSETTGMPPELIRPTDVPRMPTHQTREPGPAPTPARRAPPPPTETDDYDEDYDEFDKYGDAFDPRTSDTDARMASAINVVEDCLLSDAMPLPIRSFVATVLKSMLIANHRTEQSEQRIFNLAFDNRELRERLKKYEPDTPTSNIIG